MRIEGEKRWREKSCQEREGKKRLGEREGGEIILHGATERGGGSAAVASEGLAPSAVSSVFTVVVLVVEE